MKIEDIYLDGTYFKKNPEWDIKDSQWKSLLVVDIIKKNKINCKYICEIGCGAGHILFALSKFYNKKKFEGFDIAPQLINFWGDLQSNNLIFKLKEFPENNNSYYDLILLLDVFEHVRDPLSFLENIRNHAESFIFHIPLDLSVLSIIRSKILLNTKRKVGHLSFYNIDLALEIIKDAGFKIIDFKYTNAYKRSNSLKTKIAMIPRIFLNFFSKDLSARILGGQTLIVYAKK